MIETPVQSRESLPAVPSEPQLRLRVPVLADDIVTAEGVAVLLARSPSLRPQCHSSLADVRRCLRQGQADVVLRFAGRIDAAGVAEMESIRSRFEVPVCLLAQAIDPVALYDAYERTPEGLAVIMRGEEPTIADVFRVLVQLVGGRTVLSPAVLEQLLNVPAADGDDTIGQLTQSELAVLDLMALGLRNCAIARRLECSEKLVEKQIGRIFGKLGLPYGSLPDIDRRVTACRMFLLAKSPALVETAG